MSQHTSSGASPCRCLVAALVLALPCAQSWPASAAQPPPFVIHDGNFFDSDWQVTAFPDGAGQSAERRLDGGNPGAYRHMVHDLPGFSQLSIFHLRLGDEAIGKDVLSRVEKTFENPGSALREIVAGTETLHTTDAHPFRVEGRGWVKAKDLAAGDRLVAGAAASVVVASNRIVDGTRFYAGYERPAGQQKTAKASDLRWIPASFAPQSRIPQDTPESPTVYNIEVGTHHNYYVGASRILVHNK